MSEPEFLNKDNEYLWDNYVKRDKNARFQHLLGFRKAIAESYKNCKDIYLIFLKGTKLETLVPFFVVKSKIFGNRAISLPYLDNGGLLGKINKKRINLLVKKLKEEDLKSIELRINSSTPGFSKLRKSLKNSGFYEDKSRHQFVISLENEEKMWNSFHKDTRRDIRKGEKSNLIISEAKSISDIKEFYNLYKKKMKEFGTPQHSLKFFENLFKKCKKNSVWINCHLKNVLVASFIILHYKDYAYNPINVSDSKYKQIRVNDFLYWNSIKWCIRNKIKFLDLGQVQKDAEKESHAWGLYKFKEKWLGDLCERNYFYYYFDKSFKERSEKKSKLKKFSAIWRIMPNFLTDNLGPRIAAEMGV